ncbi:MAG: hypothetical protein M1839_007900 [Geoglossum umbratile]|nr:MAG: hypothetical protein M1839_007900 [Geoglossum umbratile]
MKKVCRGQVVGVKATMDDPKEKPTARVTIFHELLRQDAEEGHVVFSVDDLVDEAFSIVGAGSETTGNTLEIAIYYVLSNDGIYGKLTAELKESFPDPCLTLDFVTLEKLPYLEYVLSNQRATDSLDLNAEPYLVGCRNECLDDAPE